MQLRSAYEHLHEHNICHLDGKLDNVGLDKDFNIKLFDFGESEEHEGSNNIINKLKFIQMFRAPEICTTQQNDIS